MDYQIVDWTEFPPDAHSPPSVENLFWDFGFWLFLYETSPWCYSRGNNGNREERQLAHHCLAKKKKKKKNLPEKDHSWRDVLDLNWAGKKRKEMMNRFRGNKMGSKREVCRQWEGRASGSERIGENRTKKMRKGNDDNIRAEKWFCWD